MEQQATDTAEHITKTATESIRDIGKKNGPWAVLFILLFWVFFAYIFVEKRECSEEMARLRNEIETVKSELAVEKIARANCENILRMQQTTYSHYNIPSQQ